MAETNGGNIHASLDRIEAIQELMLRDHEEFRQEHKLLLCAQVVMQDSIVKMQGHLVTLERGLERLSGAQEQTEEKLHVLLVTMDKWIRRNPRPAEPPASSPQ